METFKFKLRFSLQSTEQVTNTELVKELQGLGATIR